MSKWRDSHGKVMVSFMEHLNTVTGEFILKGGTALYLCYKLDRFSEDIDLDGNERGLIRVVDAFCIQNGYSYRVGKETETVERCFINYGNNEKPLKIEASYRRKNIPPDETDTINGILVYKIEPLCVMKTNAYAGRDKIRDLYDITFIFKHYYELLSPQVIALLRGAVEYKGIEQFDYVVRTQPDELIDTDKLADEFLYMYDGLGLMFDENERNLIESNGCHEAERPDEDNEEDMEI